MITVVRTLGKMTLLFGLVTFIVVITMFTEVAIDQLTAQTRDLRHLLKHSMGNIGVLMVALSLLGYAIKKRVRKFPGSILDWLDLHQWLAVTGVALVSIHSGAHFTSVVPVATFAATLVCLISGLVGRHIYINAKKEVAGRRVALLKMGHTNQRADEILAAAAITAKTLSQWRIVHRVFAITLALLLMVHIASALYYGG